MKNKSSTFDVVMDSELRIRVSKELKDKLEKEAKSLNISLSSYIRMKISV